MDELLTPQEMARADAATIAAGTAGIELMENAGRAVADAICRRFARAPAVVVCGPGNNGGDGFVVARLLRERGWSPAVALLGDVGRLKGDAAIAAGRWAGDVVAATPQAIAGAGLIVDALFGAGLSRPIAGNAAAVVRAINGQGCPVIAVDVPSGIDGASGQVRGVAVNATLTVTFFRFKPAHVLLPGRVHCGERICCDIGIGDAVLADIAPMRRRNTPAGWRHELRTARPGAHKYARGHVLAVSGGMTSTGACRLAAAAALRIGAGLVTVASPPEAVAVNAAHLTAVMVWPMADARALERRLADRRITACVIGPGAGVNGETRALTRTVLAAPAAAVLDADALSAFAEDPQALFAAIAEKPGAGVVLTPHEGEFARLFADVASEPMAKDERALAAARRCGCVVVLKGADTVIASPGGRIVINDNAPPGLATAGSGDVLAGIIAGLTGQGTAPFEAACAGVWMHGAAARASGPGLTAERLLDQLPAALST